MTERNVTVRLRMTVRDYVAGGTEAERMNRRLAASAKEMGAAHRAAGDEVDRTSRRIEAGGRRSRRGMLYAAAGVAALGAAGGGLKLLPGLIGGTAVAGAALPPMFIGAAAAAGTLVTGVKGVGKAIGEVTKQDDPFASLGKNARAFVAEAKALQPAMAGFRQGIQDRTLAGANENLRALATITIPSVRGGLNNLATDWSEAFRQITLAVTDPHFARAFNTATDGADWFFDTVNTRIQPTIRSIMTLVQSADPLARAFGQGLINMIDRFNARVERAARTGSLQEFFADGAEGAAAFMDVVQGVFTITGQVIDAVRRQGGTLRDTAESLDRYIASGRSAADVEGIVTSLTAAYEGLRDVLGPLGGMLRDALADPGTAQAIGTMFDVLAAGTQVLRVIFDLFQLLPDGIQSTVLAAVGLAVVAAKVNAALLMVQAGAGKAATSLTAMGAAGVTAGRGLSAVTAGAGKAVGALLALQLAGAVLDQFDGAAADVDALASALERFRAKGEVSGEFARLFGDDLDTMGQAARGASDEWFPKLMRSIEGVIPPAKSLNEILFGGSFTGDVERFQALDTALTRYAQTTKDTAGAQEIWNRAYQASGLSITEFAELVPQSTAELQRMQDAVHGGGESMTDAKQRTELLGGSFREAALAGKDLAATMDLINGKNISAIEGQIRLEAAYDAAKDTLDEYGRVTRKGTHEINLNTEAGRDSMEALIGIATAATTAAAAEEKRTGSVEAGVPILTTARERIIALATAMTGSRAAAVELADSIIGIPDKEIEIDADARPAQNEVDGFTGRNKGKSLNFPIKASNQPGQQQVDGFVSRNKAKSLNFPISVSTGGANAQVQGFFDKWGRRTLNFPISASPKAAGGVSIPRQRGGVTAAASGLLRPEIYPASSPPLYQFAERQTGGELFLPRRGIDRQRGRALLGVAASWYDGMFVPMRSGGVVAAQSGLVNVAPATRTGGDRASLRLDYVESYVRAKDAVRAVSAALKEHGRTLSIATKKGRENLSTVHAAIRAAQDTARAKYEETGSVRAANAVYDAHVAALRRTLAARGASAAAIRRALAVAARPTFGTPAAPSNSSASVAYMRAHIAALGGGGDLADALSLNRPGTNIRTEHGRENLLAILDYLGSAEQAAQARFAQTRNAKTATGLYNELLADLRRILQKSGYGRAAIDSLIKMYGRITLQANLRGGAYMAAGGLGTLGEASVYPGNAQPMYGWAEKGTGGELFVPRLGDRSRAERLLAVGAGWYGGRFTPAGQVSGGNTTINNNLTVTPRTADLSIGELRGLLRQMDAEARVGRRK